MVNGATWTSGKVNGALSFDGTSNEVVFGDVLNGVNLPFTVTAWIRVPKVGMQWLMASDEAASFVWHQGWYVGLLADNRATFSVGNNTCGCSSGRFTRNSLASVVIDTWMDPA